MSLVAIKFTEFSSNRQLIILQDSPSMITSKMKLTPFTDNDIVRSYKLATVMSDITDLNTDINTSQGNYPVRC